MSRPILIVSFLFGLLLLSCGHSTDDSLRKLGGNADERAEAKNELLLAREVAVEPLLRALEDSLFQTGRGELIDVLASLMLRVGDERIAPALQRHLLRDPDSRFRGRIAHKLGVQMRLDFAPTFLEALEDTAAEVRYQSLSALASVIDRLDSTQSETLRLAARENLDSDIEKVRDEAEYVVEEFVSRWAKEASTEALKANLDAADSILAEVVAYAPASKQAQYYRGRFYFDYDQRERGLQILREHNLLVDLPRLSQEPHLDGHLDEAAWQEAVAIEDFYTWGYSHTLLDTETQTRAHLGYTDEGLYIGMYCYDAHPESLRVMPFSSSEQFRMQDHIELFLDSNYDHLTTAVFKVNTLGNVMDRWDGGGEGNLNWDGEHEVSAFVGGDFWSLELKVKWDPKYIPQPSPGDVSGFNVHRCFRGHSYSQPFRDYDSTNAPGLLVFR